MTHIIDRRADSRNKSSVNRARFIRRFKGEIRKAVTDAVNQGGIRDLDAGRTVGIPGRDLHEPQFGLGPRGVKERVLPGNDAFTTGDTLDRPDGGQGGQGNKAAKDGSGLDPFTFTLTRDEFLDVFFEELALPNLVKRHLGDVQERRWARAGYTQEGVPANISFIRTMRGAACRRVAAAGPARSRIRELEEELEHEEREGIRAALGEELRMLRERVAGVPFIDPFDLRYTNRVRVDQPSARAVMFCLMDVSGSMDEPKKAMAKRFFTLLYLFLKRAYEHIDVVFIRHHTVAEEVDEDLFFHSRESGGTVVSTALRLMVKVIRERYDPACWNIYGAQASDGDNWQEDSSICLEVMGGSIVPLVQHFAYVEISEGRPQNLWREYEQVQEVHPGTFAMRRVAQPADIYPVFHDLFRKRVP